MRQVKEVIKETKKTFIKTRGIAGYKTIEKER